MEENYNFKIIFEKLEEEKTKNQESLNDDFSLIEEINENINLINEFLTDTEEPATFTRA